MSLDYDRLLNYAIPEVHQQYSRKDMAFYSLSVGLGVDPMNEHTLDFVDANREGFRVLPSVAVILGHPGFWLAHPDTGVNAAHLVHGEQEIIWYAPIPPEGEIIGRTKVTEIIDKGTGKGALLYSEKALIDATNDRLLAKTMSTTFLRADGGFGGPKGPVKLPLPLPERAPDTVVEILTRPEQALFYRLNGDPNPLHSAPLVAAKAGFPRPILHGLCTLGAIFYDLLNQFEVLGNQYIQGLSLRFSAPVVPGETLLLELWHEGAFRVRVLARDSVVINNGQLTLQPA